MTFLVEATPDSMDPLWDPLVQPLFAMASQMVWEIQAVLGAVPARLR